MPSAIESTRRLIRLTASEPNVSEPGRPLVGSADGRYAIVGELGRGGMGLVWHGVDQELGRPVAIKEAFDRDPTAIARLLREATVTARLHHPSIVALHDLARDDRGAPLLVMQLVAGCSLEEAASRVGSLAERLDLLERILPAIAAIAFAHRQGVLHLDLKPANILLGDAGDTLVIDWGSAQVESREAIETSRPPTAATAMTTGSGFGTPGFMAPEQARGEPTDRRTDVFGLGATLFFTVTGRPPIAGATATARLERTRTTPVPSLTEVAPDVPRRIAAVVDTALAFDPAARHASVEQLGEELRQALAHAPSVASGSSPDGWPVFRGEGTLRKVRRQSVRALGGRAAVAATLIAGLALIAVTAVLWRLRVPARHEPNAPHAWPIAVNAVDAGPPSPSTVEHALTKGPETPLPTIPEAPNRAAPRSDSPLDPPYIPPPIHRQPPPAPSGPTGPLEQPAPSPTPHQPAQDGAEHLVGIDVARSVVPRLIEDVESVLPSDPAAALVAVTRLVAGLVATIGEITNPDNLAPARPSKPPGPRAPSSGDSLSPPAVPESDVPAPGDLANGGGRGQPPTESPGDAPNNPDSTDEPDEPRSPCDPHLSPDPDQRRTTGGARSAAVASAAAAWDLAEEALGEPALGHFAAVTGATVVTGRRGALARQLPGAETQLSHWHAPGLTAFVRTDGSAILATEDGIVEWPRHGEPYLRHRFDRPIAALVDEGVLMIATIDGEIWAELDGQLVPLSPERPDPTIAPALHPSRAVYVTLDGGVILIDPRSGSSRRLSIVGPATDIAMQPDGSATISLIGGRVQTLGANASDVATPLRRSRCGP